MADVQQHMLEKATGCKHVIGYREAMSQNGFKFSKPDAKLPYFWEITTVGSRTAAPAKVTSTIWAIHVVAATILKESMCLESCVTPTMTVMSGHIIVALQNKNWTKTHEKSCQSIAKLHSHSGVIDAFFVCI